MLKEIISPLNEEIAVIVQHGELCASYALTGADPVQGTVEQVRAFISRETEKHVALIKGLNIKPE